MHRLVLSAVMLSLLAVPASAQERDTAGLRDSLRSYLAEQAGTTDFGPTQLASAWADLNGDGRDEAIVFVSGSYWCGSGGCNALVLTPTDSGYAVVMDASVSQLPILVLDTTSNGWSDLGVSVGGGGAASGIAAMRFDGAAYPSNPTAPPAEILADPQGRELIADTAEGEPL